MDARLLHHRMGHDPLEPMTAHEKETNGLWYVWVRHGNELPIQESPLRFAVMMNDGSSSNSWRVWVEKEGDAYICCRDNMGEIKVSLHKSGQQHIAITSRSRPEVVSDNRYWNRWREPSHKGPVIPSFKLVFPPWGVRLDEEDRNKTEKLKRKWDDNQVLIEGDERHMVTVDFILRDRGFLLNGNGYPIETLAVLPAPVVGRPNRCLYAVTTKGSDERFKSIVQTALGKIPHGLAEKVARLRQEGETPVACLSGYGDELASYAYMIVVPVAAASDTQPAGNAAKIAADET